MQLLFIISRLYITNNFNKTRQTQPCNFVYDGQKKNESENGKQA